MKRWGLLAFLLLVPASAGAERAKVVAVIDGDTVIVVVYDRTEHIRISNIDAAEIGSHARCQHEQDLAVQAKEYLQLAVARSKGRADLIFDDRRYDKYGRGLARVILDGTDVGEDMVRLGLVRRWDGRRHPWC